MLIKILLQLLMLPFDILAALWLFRVGIPSFNELPTQVPLTKGTVIFTIFSSLLALSINRDDILANYNESPIYEIIRTARGGELAAFPLATLRLLRGAFYLPKGAKETWWFNERISLYLGLFNVIGVSLACYSVSN